MTAFVPAYPVAVSLLLSLLFLGVLGLALHVAPRRFASGSRFLLAIAITLVVWVALITTRSVSLQPGSIPWSEAFAGLLILATSLVAVFSAWTLLAHGYTTSMLLAIAEQDRPFSLEDWMSRYGSGRGLQTLAHDRLAVLVNFGLIEVRGDTARLCGPKAYRFARLVMLATAFFGIQRAA